MPFPIPCNPVAFLYLSLQRISTITARFIYLQFLSGTVMLAHHLPSHQVPAATPGAEVVATRGKACSAVTHALWGQHFLIILLSPNVAIACKVLI